MENSVTVQEEMHSFWTQATYACGITSLLLFLIFLISISPFWDSILGFGAFVFFALTVLGILKIMSGPLTVTLKNTEKHLLVTYNKNTEVIQEEQFERSPIKEVTLTGDGRNALSSYLLPDAAALKISFTDTDRRLFLFEFGGRPLFFNQTDLREIKSFLEKNGIRVE